MTSLRRLGVSFTVLALMLLCSSTVFATGGKEAKDSAETGGPSLYTIKVFANTNVKTSGETVIGKVLKDKFNIEFEYIPYTGVHRDQIAIMLASGEYPEILRLQEKDLIAKCIEAKALLPLDGYLDDLPNFKQRYEKQIPIWRSTAEDGKLYYWQFGVPQAYEVAMQPLDIGVRTDALEKQGWPNPVSGSEWLSFLKQAMRDIPETDGRDTIGMVAAFGQGWDLESVMFEKGGKYNTAGGNSGLLWNQVAKRFEDQFTNEYIEEGYLLLSRMWREGILDQECFTDKMAQVQEKMNSGLAIGIWYTVWPIGTANQYLMEAGHPERQYVNLPIRTDLQAERGDKRQMGIGTIAAWNTQALTPNTNDPERILELLNWTLSEEGQLLLQSGVEGKHYTRVDGRRIPTTEFAENIVSDPDYREQQGFYLFPMLGQLQTLAADGQPYDLMKDPVFRDELFLTERQKEAFSKLGWSSSLEYWLKTSESSPSAGIVESIVLDPNSDLGKVNAKMNEYRFKIAAKLIMTESDEEFKKAYDDAVVEYRKLDPERVIAAHNELYKSEMAKFGN